MTMKNTSIGLTGEDMKDSILKLIEDRGEHVSFAELQRHIPGFEGKYGFGIGEYNVWFWFTLSIEASNALKELMDEGKIFLHPASVLIYQIDGMMPNVPIAKEQRRYKSERWIPVTLCSYSFGGKNEN